MKLAMAHERRLEESSFLGRRLALVLTDKD